MTANNTLQMALFPRKTEWCPPLTMPDLSTATAIGIDLETRDPDMHEHGPGWPIKNGEVVGYAIAVDGWSGYFPVAHLGGGNLDFNAIKPWLKKVFESSADKVFHNAQYDVGWLQSTGFKINGRIIDTMMLGALLDENRQKGYSLGVLSFDYLGRVKSDKELKISAGDFGVHPKKELWKLPAMYVGDYAESDAELTLELWRTFEVLLRKENLWDIAKMELDLLPCLIAMTTKGIRVDRAKLDHTQHLLKEKSKEALEQIAYIGGEGIDIHSANSISKAFTKLSIDYPKTEKGNPSFVTNFLQNHEHPLSQLIYKARKLHKLSGTFINTIEAHSRVDGRVHAHINQVRSDDGGTVSGRLSMREPNLQQMPSYGHDGETSNIRSMFLPEEGEILAASDYSQQEPRLLVHFSYVYGKYRGIPLQGAEEFVKAYNNDPNTDFHELIAKMADIPRSKAKTINLGMMYGMGQAKLGEQLDIPPDAAKALIRKYHQRVPFVMGLKKGIENRLNDPVSEGTIHSILGRKCRFPFWESAEFGFFKNFSLEQAQKEYGVTTKLKRSGTYKGMNRLIQASAADMTKQAMVNCYKMGITPLLAIHDELVISVKNIEQAKEFVIIMEEAVKLEVPNKCDLKMGPSWGETKGVE